MSALTADLIDHGSVGAAKTGTGRPAYPSVWTTTAGRRRAGRRCRVLPIAAFVTRLAAPALAALLLLAASCGAPPSRAAKGPEIS